MTASTAAGRGEEGVCPAVTEEAQPVTLGFRLLRPDRATPSSLVRGGTVQDSRSRQPPPPPAPTAAVLCPVRLHTKEKMPSWTGVGRKGTRWRWMGPGGGSWLQNQPRSRGPTRESRRAGALWVQPPLQLPWAGRAPWDTCMLVCRGRDISISCGRSRPPLGSGLSSRAPTRPRPPPGRGPVQTATLLGELEALGWDVSGAEPG